METHSFAFQNTSMPKLEELQDVHYLSEMRDAARTALECYPTKNSWPSSINAHMRVLYVLNSSFRESLDEVKQNRNEKANVFFANKAEIKQAVAQNEEKIPMTSTTPQSLFSLLRPFIEQLDRKLKE